jgi:tryptophan-rich sensory protein
LLRLYVIQLAFNALWSWLFFRWHLGAAASADVLVLCALVILTTWRCSQARGAAGVLMLPYAMWVVFASALTFAIWRLNPQLL